MTDSAAPPAPSRPTMSITLPPGLRDGVEADELAAAMELLLMRNLATVSLTAQSKMLIAARPGAERIQTFEMGIHRLGRFMADLTLSFDRLRRRTDRRPASLPPSRRLAIEADLETLLDGVVRSHERREAPEGHDPDDDPRAELERRLAGFFDDLRTEPDRALEAARASLGVRFARIMEADPPETEDRMPGSPSGHADAVPDAGPGPSNASASSNIEDRMIAALDPQALAEVARPERPLPGPRLRSLDPPARYTDLLRRR